MPDTAQPVFQVPVGLILSQHNELSFDVIYPFDTLYGAYVVVHLLNTFLIQYVVPFPPTFTTYSI